MRQQPLKGGISPWRARAHNVAQRTLRRMRRQNGALQLSQLTASGARMADQPLDGAGMAYPAGAGSWEQFMGHLRRLIDLDVEILAQLEEQAYRASKRAHTTAASASLREFQQWLSYLDTQGVARKSIKDPDPERGEL
eukprot:6992592-Pyramimonas_sp.AAC.1